MTTPPKSTVAMAAEDIRSAVARLRRSMPEALAIEVFDELARSAFSVQETSHKHPESHGGEASNSEKPANQKAKQPRQRSLDAKERQLAARLDRLHLANAKLTKEAQEGPRPSDLPSSPQPSPLASTSQHPHPVPLPVHEHSPLPQPAPPPQSGEPRSASKRGTEDAPEISPLCTPTRLPAAEKRAKLPPGLHPPIPFQLGMEDSQPPSQLRDSIGLEARLFAKEAIHGSQWALLVEEPERISTYERGLHLLTMKLKGDTRDNWPQVVHAHCDKILQAQCKEDGVEARVAGGGLHWTK